MNMIDESERVARLAWNVFDTDNRAEQTAHRAILEEFCYSSARELGLTLDATGDPRQAVEAAIQAYRQEQRNVISYRRSRGLPTGGVSF